MNMTKQIIDQLNNTFAEFDQTVLEKTKEWAFDVQKEVIRIVEENRVNGVPYSVTREEKIKVCGGKCWLELVTLYSDEDMLERITTNCQRTAEKRNSTIAKKLEKLEITQVIKTKIERSNDGFTGKFIVSTDQGERTITIDNVYAGGYNIQRLHLRTLVKVLKNKVK